MSLVHLASVCSHLQNASLARLGLTSIPYTKLHLSLALLLQKQGFVSQVRLGGRSPPASVFGQGPRDNHSVTNYPHGAAGRNRLSPEAALALVVRKGYTPHQLQREGFGAEAIEFAQEHGLRTAEDLEKAGWAQKIHLFINDLRAQINALADERESEYLRTREDLTAIESFDESTRRIDDLHRRYGNTIEERYARVEDEVLASIPVARAELYRQHKDIPSTDRESTKFDLRTLQILAGRQSYISERELRLNGITIEAMGLRVPNQSITLPEASFQDPAHMETEGVVTKENRASRRLWLGLKYYESLPVLTKAQMISKPTKRIWLDSKDIGRLVRGKQAGEVKPIGKVGEIMAVSTDRGVMEARECVERKIGGMPLCRVW